MKYIKKILILLFAVCITGCAAKEEAGTGSVNEPVEADDNQINYDLTVMGADMVYATVYQMMVEPESYIGKRFKIKGSYYSSYDNKHDIYYHFCMIKDAAACCAQGIELSWKDDNMRYPINCPEEDSFITVEGVFETYKDPIDNNTYGRLKDAVITDES